MGPPGEHAEPATPDGSVRAHAPATVAIVLLVALGTLASGIAIVWLRFSAAGLAGWQAVRRVSPVELLGIGATHLVLGVAVGAVALLVAFVIDRRNAHLVQALAATALAVAGVEVAILLFDSAEPTARITAAILTASAGVAAALVALATTPNPVHEWLERHGRTAAIAAAVAVAAADAALWAAGERLVAGVVLATALLAAALLHLALIPAQPPGSRWRRIGRKLGGWVRSAAGPCGVAVVAVAVGALLGSIAAGAVVVLAGGLAAGLLWLVRRRRDDGWHFRRYAVGVVIAVEAFAVALVSLDAWQDPAVRPVAVLAADGGELAGFVVTDSPRSLYVGRARHCTRGRADLVLAPARAVARGSGTVTPIAHDDIRARSTGRPTAVAVALVRAAALLDDLRAKAGLPRHGAAGACAGEGTIDLRRRAHRDVAPEEAARLAARYRPILKFDSTERWRPLNVDHLLAEERDGAPLHRICTAATACAPLTSGAQLEGLDRTAAIDIDGHELEGADARSPDLAACPAPQPPILRDCDGGSRSAVYYHAVRANGRVYVDYWWFLRYNHFARYGSLRAPELCRNRITAAVHGLECNEHEGDWEGVTAVTAVGDPQRLEFVDYAQHTIVRRYAASALRREGDRAVVYVAEGSHASYASACPRGCGQFERIVFDIARPEANTDGLADWARNDAGACERGESCLLALPTGTWGRFAGLWGSRACVSAGRGCKLGVPPRSPARQPRYRFPWCYIDERAHRLTCDPGR